MAAGTRLVDRRRGGACGGGDPVVAAVARYRRNAYRREALRQLDAVDPGGISTVLKRTALAAWPREQVAALTGAAWLAFLDRTGRTTAFTDGAGRHIETLAFGGAIDGPPADAARAEAHG